MKPDRLAEIIRELWRELCALDECIAALETLATGRPKRGRPRKARLPPEKMRPQTQSR
jgi:hypothetical protein